MVQQAAKRTDVLLKSGSNELELITFSLQWRDPETNQIATTTYGINAAKVMELVAMPGEITAIAESPACVLGIFLLRERTIPLIDLCDWFNYEPDTSDVVRRKWTVIVSEMNGKLFGFVTHGVDKVYRVSWDQIKVPPDIIADAHSLTGICLVENQIIQLVDFEHIISSIDPSMNIENRHDLDNFEAGDDFRGTTVVIADDSKTIRLQMQNMLEKAGFKIIPFTDGQSAWNYLDGLQGQVQSKLAVVSDIEMPGMDGHHLCKRIKEAPAFVKVPVILFSSLINDSLRHKGETVGADDQVTKPEIGTLVDRIQSCLEKLQNDIPG